MRAYDSRVSERERRAIEVRVSTSRCPYCHEGIPRGVEPGVCAECHALHHRECLEELGRCGSCGAGREHATDRLVAVRGDSRPAISVGLGLTLAAQLGCLTYSLGYAIVDLGRSSGTGLAWTVAVAALGGVIVTVARGVFLGWAAFSGMFGLGLLLTLGFAHEDHRSDLLAAATLLGGACFLFLTLEGLRRRRQTS